MEYPNAKITANIAPHTQWGRIIIPHQVLPNENPDNNPKFMRGGKFIEDYETGDCSKIGKWMNLPTFYNLYSKYTQFRNSGLAASKYTKISATHLFEKYYEVTAS